MLHLKPEKVLVNRAYFCPCIMGSIATFFGCNCDSEMLCCDSDIFTRAFLTPVFIAVGSTYPIPTVPRVDIPGDGHLKVLMF